MAACKHLCGMKGSVHTFSHGKCIVLDTHDGLQNNELTLNSYSRSDSRRTFKPKTEMNSFCVQMCEDLI